MRTLLMGRSKKQAASQKPAASGESNGDTDTKRQIWVYTRDARDIGLLTNYLGMPQAEVFVEVLRKVLMERVALEESRRAMEKDK